VGYIVIILENGENKMKFKLEIDMNNASFDNFPFLELHDVLNEVSHNFSTFDCKLSYGHFDKHERPIRDTNGNKIGIATLEVKK
tara:strand:+ start:286 stop:537 length:252 start_codon:yes stop_codon:yes gene_type:complete